MELKSLIIGIVFTLGIFALKSGVGLQYYLVQKRKVKTRLLLFFMYAAAYLFIFLLCAFIIQKGDIASQFARIQSLVKSGMLIHVLMAGGLVIWGIILLKRKESSLKATCGWLALVIPCPVCITVIFFSTAFLLSWFPHSGYMAVSAAYLGFMFIVVITVTGMLMWRAISNSTPESTLGAAMLIIAAYFFLSVIIIPQFGDIDRLYRLAAYQNEKQIINIKDALILYSAIIVLFTTSYWTMKRKIKNTGK
jgi:predicted transporter